MEVFFLLLSLSKIRGQKSLCSACFDSLSDQNEEAEGSSKQNNWPCCYLFQFASQEESHLRDSVGLHRVVTKCSQWNDVDVKDFDSKASKPHQIRR